MTTPTSDPRDRGRAGGDPADDPTIVPGLGPSGPLDRSQDPDRYDPSRARPSGPLDMSQDPDRYDATADLTAQGGPLDRSLDPDRPVPPGQGQTLTDLLGDGAHETPRDNMQWAWSLLAIVAFLAFVSWFFTNVASP